MRHLQLSAEDMNDLIAGRGITTILDSGEEVTAIADTPEPNMWTVLGFWNNDEPVSVGAVRGDHVIHGGRAADDYQGPWSSPASAATVEEAESLAIAAMLATLREHDVDAVHCERCGLMLERDSNGEWWAPGEEYSSSCSANDGGAHDPDREADDD